MPHRTILGQWHPHELFLCAVCVLTGATGVVTEAAPGSIRSSLPGALVATWAVILFLSGLAVLSVWAVVRDRASAAIIERLALVPLSLMLVVYAIAAVGAVGWGASLAAGMSVAFAAANVVRIWQITKWLHALPRRKPRS